MFDLTCTFNPLFPAEYYNDRQLLMMARHEGYNHLETISSSPYDLMQTACLTKSFHLGPWPNLTQQRTIFQEEITDIPPGELLSYGQISPPEISQPVTEQYFLYPISLDELIGLFQANKNFTDPFTPNSVFSNGAIAKLKAILTSHRGPVSGQPLTQTTLEKRAQLYDLITRLEIISTNDEGTRQLCLSFEQVEQKEPILDLLQEILRMGMYMRGWEGPSQAYPVIRAQVPPEKTPAVFARVTDSILRYENKIQQLGSLGRQINSLPLVRYRDGHYQAATTATEGRTIGERIKIVKEGDDSLNMSSCIRLSSNWLCASAHKYLISLGQPAPFDIIKLRDIS